MNNKFMWCKCPEISKDNDVTFMNWISLKDKKPKYGYVLVYRSYMDHAGRVNDNLDIALYWPDRDCFTIGSDAGQPWNPEYWCPIPVPPWPYDEGLS